MQIISWNVASWQTTLAQVRAQHGSLSQYLDQLHCDILCVQETKLTRDKLANAPKQYDATLEGWESFWSCCRTQKKGAQGFNGVATFARAGLTCAANPEPYLIEEMDQEGRCLMTDHGSFVIFNVYIPTNGPSNSKLPFKLRMLNRLRECMAEQRQKGKAVVLAGDFNLARRKEDVPWNDRLVHLSIFEASNTPVMPEALRQKIAEHLDSIPGKANGGGKFNRKVDVYQAIGENGIKLGRRGESRDSVLRAFSLEQFSIVDQDGQSYVIKPRNTLAVAQLTEIFAKKCEISLTLDEQQAIAACGTSYSAPSLVQWAEELTVADGMVDTFAELYPAYCERFSCWDQYTNRRYENEGARIDYIYMDRVLFDKHVRPGKGLPQPAPLRNGDVRWVDLLPTGAEAALWCATSGGLFKQAPFDGSGLDDAPRRAYELQFEWLPGTGLVYTPPKFSDHIACAVILDGFAVPTLVLSRDKSTRAAQPFAGQTSIKSFLNLARRCDNAATEPTTLTKPGESGVSSVDVGNSPLTGSTTASSQDQPPETAAKKPPESAAGDLLKRPMSASGSNPRQPKRTKTETKSATSGSLQSLVDSMFAGRKRK